jgi:hypothetical protein
MKIYKCDMCKNEFDPDSGMIKGRYTSNRKVRWKNPGGFTKELKVVRTLKIYRNIPTTKMLPGHEVAMALDVCKACVGKFERP